MEKKLEIKICTGTTCYLFGSEELLSLPDMVPEHLKQWVEVTAVRCLEHCRDCHSKAPFVQINGETFAQATPDSLKAEVLNRLQYKEDKYGTQ
jgi:NADH:ubiquinone oxidoreductase subunit E